MSWPLLRKELRDQRWLLGIGVVLVAIDLLDAVTRQIDREPLGRLFGSGVEVGFQVLVAFAVGTGLLMHEDEEGTLGFLDGLPVTRAGLYVTKVAVAGAVLLVYPLGHVLLMAVQHELSRSSLNAALHPRLLLVLLALTASATFLGLFTGLLLGFLRGLAWLTFGVCAAALMEGIERWPWLSVFDPIELMKPRLVGDRWRVPMQSVAVQVGVSAACAVSALLIFVSAGRRRDLSLDRWLKRPVVSSLVGAAMIAVTLWVGWLLLRESPAEAEKRVLSMLPGAFEFPDAPPGHAETRHYTFSYPSLRSEQLRPFLLEGDRTFEAVVSLMGAGTEAAIDVDLSGSVRNTEGTAFLNRIRMSAAGSDPLATLAHETTHVFAQRLAGGEKERELSKMVVFDEGLARWIELHIAGEPIPPDLDRLQAAVVSRRSLVSPEMLINYGRLARLNDENLKYPLGVVLVDAFIQRYGAGAPRALLTTLARPDFPRDLHGLELWQATFQLAGFDLALTLDDYSSRLKGWENEFAPMIEKLPRPRGVLVRQGSLVGVEVRIDGPLPDGWTTVVRFRPTDQSPLYEYNTEPTIESVAWESRQDVVAEEVCFQPGLDAGGITLFEAWNCLPLDSASDPSQSKGRTPAVRR